MKDHYKIEHYKYRCEEEAERVIWLLANAQDRARSAQADASLDEHEVTDAVAEAYAAAAGGRS